MSDIDQMIKMANQIAENFSYHDDQVDRTADHIQRFWAPTMRTKLTNYIEAGGEGLSDIAIQAFRMLAQQR